VASREERREAGGGAPAAEERKPFLLRLPAPLFEELRAWAADDLRSLNGHIEWILREALRKRRGGAAGRSGKDRA
jgi:hypothetical protein